MSKKVEAVSAVSLLHVRKSIKKQCTEMGEGLAKATEAGATWRQLGDAARISTINLIAGLVVSLDPLFTRKDRTLRAREDHAHVTEILEYAFSFAVDTVREAGHNLHDLLEEQGETPPFDRNDMGKNTNKAIREKRREFQNLGVCLLSPSKRVRDDARAMCSPWIPGEPNASWGARKLVWKSGVQHLIAKSNLEVMVGRGAQEGSALGKVLYYLGDSVKSTDAKSTETFGTTKKNKYTVDMDVSRMKASVLYATLDAVKGMVTRYLTQVSSALTRLEDEFTPEVNRISYKDTRPHK